MYGQINQLFSPKAIAIIGATIREGAIGNTAVRNFRVSNYQGDVYPINPRYEEIEGFTCYPNVKDIKEQIDMAIIAVPGERVEGSVRDCVEQGIRNVLIFSSGFAEMGEEGKKMQNGLVSYCKQQGVRILGPNTLGMLNVHEDLALMFQDIGYTVYEKGEVGLVAQSGATGSQILSMASEEKVGFSYMVATGNQPDLDTIEVLDYYIQDKQTKVASFYMEGVPSGKRFLSMAEKALEANKPVVGIKSGRSSAGQKAALSHTASLTGSNEIFEVAAKKYGVTIVDGFEQLIDSLKVFQSGKRPKGNRVATVVVSGAVGILLADALELNGLLMAELSQETKKKLREQVANYCSVENPVDIASTFILNEQVYPHAVQTLVDSDEVDMIIIHLPVPTALNPQKFAEMFVKISKTTDKPIFVVPTGLESEMAKVRHFLTENHVPAYRHIEGAVHSAKAIYQYECMRQKYMAKQTIASSDVPIMINSEEQSIAEHRVKEMLRNHDVPVPNGLLIRSVAEISQFSRIAYPVVAKIASVDIAHKSDVGGVVLNIENAQQLKNAYHEILSKVRFHHPEAKIDGIFVEEMSTDRFIEFFVGVQNDELFGPVLTCGLGGIFVEVLKDVSRQIGHVSKEEARQMVESLKGAAILKGARRHVAFDIDALAEAISNISQIATSLEGNWQDFEINPLVVFEEGKGVLALDGLITLKQTAIPIS
ncbi:acetate--CoA ligase family protein [Neobacillus sp. C211]|uniref:acetate--CoA ligase family protein n=1 Tax=unclassified Neobacillus TaxID=2675272 RepID=UPI0039792C65